MTPWGVEGAHPLGAERKEFAQIPMDTSHVHLYPGWFTVGAPWKEGQRELIMLRKRIAPEFMIKEGDN